MKKELKKSSLPGGIFSAAAGMLLLWALIYFLVLTFVVNEGLFYKTIKDEDLAERLNVSESDLRAGAGKMVSYVKGKGDLEITVVKDGVRVPFFSNAEKEHLSDVKELLARFSEAALISLIVAVGIYTGLILKGRGSEIAHYSGYGFLLLFVLLALVAIYAFTHTRDFIDIFHEVLFAGKRWVFNGKESLMVHFFAKSLYKAAAVRVIVICAAVIFFFQTILFFMLKR